LALQHLNVTTFFSVDPVTQTRGVIISNFTKPNTLAGLERFSERLVMFGTNCLQQLILTHCHSLYTLCQFYGFDSLFALLKFILFYVSFCVYVFVLSSLLGHCMCTLCLAVQSFWQINMRMITCIQLSNYSEKGSRKVLRN